tara:strand:+ start:4559 stop:5002 length:444 start_codon:yes stop_codon:yes gene_type:complete
MTIKEFFEIEPIQKNSIIVIIFVCFISFLQLYLFKDNFVNEKDFVKIALSISVAICWITAEIPTYIFALPILIKSDANIFENRMIEFIIISYGFGLIFWMVTATYISYELDLDMKNFIRISIAFMFFKNLYWFIRYRKNKNQKPRKK